MKTMSFGNPHVISAGLVVTLLTGLSALSITDVSLPASPITYKHELGRKLGVGDDIVLTRHLLWADEVSNAAQCAMKCLEHQGCLGFWFREPDVEVGTTVSLGKCRAHSTLCDDQLVCPVPANTTALGFRFYGFLGKAARCAQGDLEPSFLKYDASMLHGNMVVGQAETSWLRCTVTCLLALGTCRSVDLDHSRGLCFANGDDVVGALPWLFLGADPNYVHLQRLQRTCK